MKQILTILFLIFLACKAYAWYGVSPYAYCAGDPVNCVDVDGKDARVVIDGNNMTITANIVITGEYATQELADLYKQSLEETWGQLNTYVSEDGTSYNLSWQLSVVANPTLDLIEKTPSQDGVTNYFQVINTATASSVNLQTGYTGKIRSVGVDGLPLSLTNPMPHEFGHLLGLRDLYDTNKKSIDYGQPLPGVTPGEIMAYPSGVGIPSVHTLTPVMEPLLNFYKGRGVWASPTQNLGNSFFKQ